jgi:L-ascorbate metabolism protein UlaG (beta-lactamase superfamily)
VRRSLDGIDRQVPTDSVRMWWLGQAGFAFKTSVNQVFYVDPYLSDACDRLHGFVRLSLPPVEAEAVRADWVIFTHEHADHLDPDTVPLIGRNNPGCRFAGPVGCAPALAEAGIPEDRIAVLKPNQRHKLDSLTVQTVPADHGELSRSALTLLLDFGSVRVLVSGDTSWRSDLVQPLTERSPDVVLPVINGAYGNMDHLDAAMMVGQALPRFAIPCHFWMFAEHGAADPAGFLDACRDHSPNTEALVVKPGAEITICARKTAERPKRKDQSARSTER